MTAESTKRTTMTAVRVLQEAVMEEMEKKAKLGQQAVVSDRNGKPRVVSARYLVRKMRTAEKQG